MKTIKLAAVALLLSAVAMLPIAPSLMAAQEAQKNVVVLSKSNLVLLNDEINGESAAKVIEDAKALDKGSLFEAFGYSKKKPIYVFLFTPGGDIQAGLELLEGLHGINRPVNTITSFSASMGFQLAQNLGDRLILKSGVLMSHHAVGGSEGEIGGKSGSSQLNNRLGLWERRLKEMDEETVRRTNGKQTLASYQEAYDHELWLTGSEAVKQGYADRIVTIRCDRSLDGYTTHETLVMGIIPVQYDISNCPLNTTPVNVRVKVPTNKGDMTLTEFESKGGGFGVACLQWAVLDNTKVCATDTSLTTEQLKVAPKRLLDRYTNIRNYVIPMSAQ